jgi:hypothetical protein
MSIADMTNVLDTENTNPATETDGPRKPRIALMGEFSAGKSTLANLMIGADSLPMQVIATQIPPVWIAYGTGKPVHVDIDGNETPCRLEDLSRCAIETTRYIRIFCEEDILQMCDLIDMPGISDPNMTADVWQWMMPYCDGVIWCTPATQAWRQSEAAVWDELADRLAANSILLMTRADMLITDRDRQRVLRRVREETKGKFSTCLLISLLMARDAEADLELWTKSGADPFVSAFLKILDRLSRDLGLTESANPFAEIARQSAVLPDPQAKAPRKQDRVVPRRPSAISETRRTLCRPGPH